MIQFNAASRSKTIAVVITLLAMMRYFAGTNAGAADEKKPLVVGDMAPALELESYDTGTVKLDEVTRKGPVVVMVLRGNPGYQCPLCTRQVGEFIAAAKKFDAANATVILIYPGPAARLKSKAKDFLKGTTLPKGFQLLIDPDYAFTKDWHLRWDAPQETAYPSTFIIDKDGKIQFAKVSKSHGDRAAVEDVIRTLGEI